MKDSATDFCMLIAVIKNSIVAVITKIIRIILLFVVLQMQGCNELFKVEDFTPYDPTQDVIFPPELMVSL